MESASLKVFQAYPEYLGVNIKVLVAPSLASSAEILQRTVKGWLIQNRPFGRHR